MIAWGVDSAKDTELPSSVHGKRRIHDTAHCKVSSVCPECYSRSVWRQNPNIGIKVWVLAKVIVQGHTEG